MSTAPTGKKELARNCLRQRALAVAAEQVVAGHLDGRIELALAAHGCQLAFADRAELAAAAQTQWWQRLLGRLDSRLHIDVPLDDDLSPTPAEQRMAAVHQAWTATVHELPGFLALAALAASHVTVRRGTLHYARLLALFAGVAAADDEPIAAARAGMRLVERLAADAVSLHPVLHPADRLAV